MHNRRLKKYILPMVLLLAVLFWTGVAVAAGEIGNDGRFIAYDDGTVLDGKTGLMWAAEDNGADINWADAQSYCEKYTGAGYTDWRMPTQEELLSIFDPASDKKNKSHKFITLSDCCPWTGDIRGKKRAVSIIFIVGERNVYAKTNTDSFRALPVRVAK